MLAAIVLEVTTREDLQSTSGSFLLGLGLTISVFWRRSRPLLMTVLAFTATGIFEAIGMATGSPFPDLNAMAFMLVLPYALFRWGSGREALLGLPVILLSATLGLVSEDLSLGEYLGGTAVLLSPIAIGIAVRYRDAARRMELEDVRSSERLTLARELHDTIAHHVSAIAVRAQAGLATAPKDGEAGLDALRVIRDEASLTLSEMRDMVRVLRDDEAGELAPAPRLEDLASLDGGRPGQLPVHITLNPAVSDLSPALSGAIYRIAQESVTNAQRHARGATGIQVKVSVNAKDLILEVSDDGELPNLEGKAGGFGLLGMTERAQLLGGMLQAGPGPERGWIVTATIPYGETPTTT